MQIPCEYCQRRNNEDAELCKSCGAPIKAEHEDSASRWAGAVSVSPYCTNSHIDGFPMTRLYIVDSGDSWAKIAQKFYGDQRALVHLQDANPHINITLCEGMEIRLPNLPEYDFQPPKNKFMDFLNWRK